MDTGDNSGGVTRHLSNSHELGSGPQVGYGTPNELPPAARIRGERAHLTTPIRERSSVKATAAMITVP